LVWGQVQENKATINAPIGRHPLKRMEMLVTAKNSKEAITHFHVLERFNDFAFIFSYDFYWLKTLFTPF
jgi:23S rRNA pseudouridine1911/1915/1917 synthase